MALNAYLQQTSRILHDPNNQNFSTSDLTAYINIARGQIAIAGQCVRKLNIVTLSAGTETYSLPSGSAFTGAGVGQAVSVNGVSVPWGTTKPTLDRYSWSDFQAQLRLFSGTITGFPEAWAQQGDGASGLVYLFPIPSQTFASEWDCFHTVAPLASDSDPEAIPYPFTDCVPYFAAYLALLNAQRYQEAKAMLDAFKMFLGVARGAVSPLFTPSAYPTTPGSRA